MKNGIYVGLLAVGILVNAALAGAQTGAGDSRGVSALVPQDGWLDVNAADASAGISYLDLANTPGVPVWGFSVKAKSSEGIASLLSSARVAPGVEAQFYAGPKVGTQSKGLLLARFKYWAEATSLFSATADYDSQVKKSTFEGHDIGLLFQTPVVAKSLIFGVATGVRRVNNYSDLTSVTLREEKAVGTGSDGATRIQAKEVKARSGDYLVANRALYLDADVIRQLGSSVYSLAARLRTIGNVPAAMRGNGVGLDFGVGTGDDPYSRRFIIGFDIEDTFRQRPDALPLSKRLRLSLSASAKLASLWGAL